MGLIPNFKNLSEQQLRNWIKDFAGSGYDIKAMAELQRRGIAL